MCATGVEYATGALCLVLAMDEQCALEHAEFAKENDFSCLGTWQRKECLKFAEKLNGRDIDVRVVPAVRGKQAWQNPTGTPEDDRLPAGAGANE